MIRALFIPVVGALLATALSLCATPALADEPPNDPNDTESPKSEEPKPEPPEPEQKSPPQDAPKPEQESPEPQEAGTSKTDPNSTSQKKENKVGGPPEAAPPPKETPTVLVKLPSWLPPVEIEPGLDIIAAYTFKLTPGPGGASDEWFHNFEMSRVMPKARIQVGPATASLILEGLYSASEGALIGVAGDSFIMRVREATVGARYKEWVAVQAGIVPTYTIPLLDQAFGLRALGPLSGETTGFTSPADLGARVTVSFPKGYGFAGVGAYNGDGYTNRELNRGKNIELAALIHPMPQGALAPLGLYAAYVNGSSGTGLARADRVTTALLWESARVRLGVALTYAMGVRDDGAKEALSVDWSLRAEPIERLILGARGLAYIRDMRAGDDRIISVTGLLGFRIAPPLETFIALTRQLPDATTLSALPGSDYWEGRAAARFLF